MNILILSASHPYKTAGVVAFDLYKRLKAIEGVEVKMVVQVWDRYPDSDIKSMDTILSHYTKKVLKKVSGLLKKAHIIKSGRILKARNACNPDYSVQDYDQTITYYKTHKILQKAGFVPDKIIVLFMTYFLSYKNLHELNIATKAPIYLYMMDMALFTAGCHYAWDCLGFIKQCGNCPAMNSKTEKDQSSMNWLFKKRYIDKTDLIAISGSEWQYQQLKSCSLYRNIAKYHVLIDLNENTYSPADKLYAKEQLNLPTDKKIILIGAVSLSNRRKGGSELIQILNLVIQKLNQDEKDKIHVLIAGRTNSDFESQILLNRTSLGYLSQDRLVKAFQAADVFLSPSIEDSGPMMVNQSMLCGTPVVSFEMGIAMDLVVNDMTGYRVNLRDIEGFAKAIIRIIHFKGKDYNTMTNNCRVMTLESMKRQNIVNLVLNKSEFTNREE